MDTFSESARGAVTRNKCVRLPAEVESISANGFWIFLGDREVFLVFEHFPWFRDAPVATILSVERPSQNHLYWPLLDIDISIESIDSPGRFPLVSHP